jgi:predicted nucleic acid-binding Zn ribbon protein
MLSTEIVIRPIQSVQCAKCGEPVKANVQMMSDAPVVCSKCRCCRCHIVLSRNICRCGLAHGKPSGVKQLCDRCFEILVETGAYSQPHTGILEDTISDVEEAFDDDDLFMDDGPQEADGRQEADELEFHEELVEELVLSSVSE